jgi:Protein of unknown function (DUF2971)
MASAKSTEVLWHYTDASGLQGIVTTGQLRFGDARFLNDRTERVYGERLLERALEEVLSAESDTLTNKFRELLQVLREPYRLYVCSFSATTESISQWQRYGADGTGYCLGFDLRELDRLFDNESVSRYAMVYEEAEQLKILREAVRDSFEQYSRLEAKAGKRKATYIDYLFVGVDIDAALLRMKNPFFHDEKESRYLFRTDEERRSVSLSEPREQYAARGPYIKPFVQLPHRNAGTGVRLPIVRVVCGPRLEPDLAIPSLRRFLAAVDYEAVQVDQSVLAEIWR